ncbi:MAG: glycosyl transferase [Pseudomonadota bacterium]
MEKQVICINWGTKYGPAYINRLYGMVARNITPPFRFVCFTDAVDGIRPEVETKPLPELLGSPPTNTLGQWGKSRLWAKDLGGLSGAVLFVDLDVVVTGSLDDFFSYGAPDDVILARNPAKPLHRLGQTSVYRFPIGKLSSLLEAYAKDPQGTADAYRFEQHFVTKSAPGGIRFWPRRWVRHFRLQCIPKFPLNFFLEPRKPGHSKIVIFAGAMNPPEAIAGHWNPGEPDRTPWQHLRHCYRTGAKLRRYRQYLHPTPWISDLWRP